LCCQISANVAGFLKKAEKRPDAATCAWQQPAATLLMRLRAKLMHLVMLGSTDNTAAAFWPCVLTAVAADAYLIRFLDVMRGTRIAAPTRLLPVTKIPLCEIQEQPSSAVSLSSGNCFMCGSS
jgi:hypothetical protein